MTSSPLMIVLALQLPHLSAPGPVEGVVVIVLLVAIAALVALTIVFISVAVLFRVRNRNKAVLWERLEAKWDPLIVEVLSESRAGAELAALVQKGEELYFVDYLYRYARRVRGSEREILAEIAAPYLPRIARHLEGGDAERRARAVQTLSVLGLESYWSEFSRALDDPSPLVSMIAARAISRREHPESAKPVLDRLHLYGAWSPNFLASMLANIGSEAAPALRSTLGDPDVAPSTRAVAADALRKLNDYGAADVAVRVLETETQPDLLAAALRLLRRIGRPAHLQPARALLSSPSFAVRAQAMGVVGRLGGPAEVDPLRSGLDDPSPWVAIQAARGLRDLGVTDLLHQFISENHSRADFARQILAEQS